MEAVSIAALWSRLLDGGAPVRPDDDFFFDLEGNSLLAASIVSELSLSTGLPVELRDLYLAPTPREFAGYLDHLNRRLGEYRTNLAAGFDLGVIADALAELAPPRRTPCCPKRSRSLTAMATDPGLRCCVRLAETVPAHAFRCTEATC